MCELRKLGSTRVSQSRAIGQTWTETRYTWSDETMVRQTGVGTHDSNKGVMRNTTVGGGGGGGGKARGGEARMTHWCRSRL